LAFLTVSPNLTSTFPMLPDPISNSELESLSLRRRFFPVALLPSQTCPISCSIAQKTALWDWFSFHISWWCKYLDFLIPYFWYLQQSFVLCVVYVPPYFLQRLQCFLVQAFLGTLVVDLVPGHLFPFFFFLILVGSFLGALCVGSFLGTYALNSLERHEKRTYGHGHHTFLVKVELILPHIGAHSKNVTCQISLGEWYVNGYCTGLGAWAEKPARWLCNVGVELFYTLHKLRHADALGLLENVRDVVPLLLSHIVGKHSEKVEHHAVIE
jgi:hypothetical protein